MGCRVAEEGLQKDRADIRSIVVNGDRPDVVGEHAAGPSAGLLEQDPAGPGTRETGPMPQIESLDIGERKKLCTVSPGPDRSSFGLTSLTVTSGGRMCLG